MKILQVVTLISPDGAYGGPARVATNQLETLADFGYEVTIAASVRGYRELPIELSDRIPALFFPARKLMPGLGFAGTFSYGLLREIWRHAERSDVMHIHLSRDFVTLPSAAIALARRVPYVVQTHGMIDQSSKLLSKPLDAILTRRVMRGASAVLYLTEVERNSLLTFMPDLDPRKLVQIVNGVPVGQESGRRGSSRLSFLFLARLHERKRPVAFVEALSELKRRGLDFEFGIVGPDGGEGPAVRRRIDELGLSDRGRWEGPLSPEETASRMAEADVYVLPSVREPFPMSVLEAMANGLPSIVTRSCGLAEVLELSNAGIAVGDSVLELSDAMEQMTDASFRGAMAARARNLADTDYSMEKIGAQLMQVYRGAMAGEKTE